MSRKILFSVCLLLFSVLLLCAFSGCKEPLEELAPPDNLRVEKRILYWDEVENAAGYVLNIGKEEFTVTDCSFPLYSFTADGELCIIDVAAIGDGKEYDDSPWARIDVSLDAVMQNGFDESGLEYTLLEDKGGYEVSRGYVELEGTVTIPSFFNDYPVKRIAEDAFIVTVLYPDPFTELNCNRLTTSFILPEHLESIGDDAFAGCVKIEEIVIPESVTEIGEYAFYACTHLKKVNIPKGIKSIRKHSFSCTALEEIVIPDSVEEIGPFAFACEYYRFGSDEYPNHINSALSSIVIPESVKKIDTAAFVGRENLVNITFPNTVDELYEHAFHDTAWYQAQPDGLIILDKFLYYYKGEMPENSEITIPENLKVVSQAFQYQDNLIKVTIPSSVSLIGEFIFRGCPNLREVILPDGLRELPTGTFSGASSLKSITIPDTVTAIGHSAFNRSGLESIYIPGSVKTIDPSAFERCENLHTVYMEDGVLSIGATAFSLCPKLTDIRLSGTLKNIDGGAFKENSAEMIIFPKLLERVYNRAFAFCENLTCIYYEGDAASWNKLTADLSSETIHFSDAVIYLYSEKAPEAEGNFWRYVDGVPTIW
ncbi:MAG: leucine-rich repeat domain-containing protein [Clostridia bacterium]|nr:leucine-rich repeat domain-containing protein [Clostridia bacterium]